MHFQPYTNLDLTMLSDSKEVNNDRKAKQKKNRKGKGTVQQMQKRKLTQFNVYNGAVKTFFEKRVIKKLIKYKTFIGCKKYKKLRFLEE